MAKVDAGLTVGVEEGLVEEPCKIMQVGTVNYCSGNLSLLPVKHCSSKLGFLSWP